MGASTRAFAAGGDCAQPVSTGVAPVASDCLFILGSAVGIQTCDPVCICDLNASGGAPTATDALACLSASVGLPGLLNCPCDAPTTDDDDFDDNAKDTTKWGTDEISGNGILIEAVTRLEYRCDNGRSYDEAYRPWIKSALPYDSDWEAQIDLRNLTTPSADNQVSSFGLEIRNPNDDGDYVYAELYASALEGLPVHNGFYGEIGFDQGNYASVDTNDLGLTAGAGRMAFDAATKVVTLFYDYPGGGYDWVAYGSFGLAGSGGEDGNGAWGLSTGAQLSLHVYGYSAHMDIPLARVYGDNFSVTGAVAP